MVRLNKTFSRTYRIGKFGLLKLYKTKGLFKLSFLNFGIMFKDLSYYGYSLSEKNKLKLGKILISNEKF